MSAPRTPVVADPVVVAAGTTAADAVAAAGLPMTGPKAIVVVRDPLGQLRDLDWKPAEETTVEPVSIDSPDGLNVLRHSTAHVLAQAVQDVFPDAKLGIGPPIDNGFYYDFQVDKPFQPDDLAKLEKRMQEIVKSGQRFRRRRFTSLDEAKTELAAEPFKLELIDVKGEGLDSSEVMEVGGGELTIYDNLAANEDKVCWSDLCRGPHLPNTRLIGAFKLMRSAAAYWRGSEKNPQLQRVYGTAWPTRDELKAYLKLLEEAARRDHRKLGADLDLFSFPDEIGSGLAVFHPKGGVIKRVMEDYVRARHIEEGFQYVGTPHISKEGLFHTSGHLPYYADGMYPPMELEGADYYLKAMNCPMHNLIYRSRGRSYRQLPMRLFEFGSVYRYEKSGVVHGLTRVRGLTQDDSHSYCTREQAPAEIKHLLGFVLSLLKDFGIDDFYLELSTRDENKLDKFVGSDEDWATATAVLEQCARETGLDLVPDPGGAAFYGPKISVQAKDAIGRTWQLSTIQYDFNQPKGFGLEYQAADGTRQQPVMIHCAKFGSIERFIGVLTEHYAGAFPAWLAPVQVVGIPIRDDHADYLQEFVGTLTRQGIRAEVDFGDDRMQKKIRNAQQQKIPFMVIAGDDDVAAGTVSFRYRDGSQRNGVPIAEAVAHVVDVVTSRTNAGPSAEG
ncbi:MULTISPECIES: threonine--tRNA ligase [Micromonospora]|uniref:Threonine--tRNA ligase n=1 Tax=Micromonospora solifontis TaxID=2487138 RepID=A0ABX9WH19_9ACTN|nr:MULTISPECIES: threonine--tRNA ligase [Micromonospora]NES13404.1 threonine--tRNA ligase [Micromonospora sp. PPF5-17B]NES37055.1 threonine--tRNA ligase [Micromonospora solifontis]NES55580.1 threonine--tRNA ligase [Micromonospora sp. PPF5-6]RNL98839.1 threonine--tRNA ligase [Micromonospora solifontis]